MTIPRYHESSIHIDAPASRVWQVLTDSAYTKHYMFGCEIVSDWSIGGRFDWKGAADGVIYVKGQLEAAEPDRLLRYTMIDPHSSLADVPENYLTMTCELVPKRGGTTLRTRMGDFTAVGNGAKRYEDTIAGGDGMLRQLKAVAEATSSSR
ncbi:MAG TPA: SRPBCC domain-containing protein [Gemmatimonadaceae bacterium]|nr:SRPBCC domain-containing protein [Gemmatimonadaceae bacterium]